MDAALFIKIISDKSANDLGKLQHKYSNIDINELVELYKSSLYKNLPIWDFSGNDLVFIESFTQIPMNALKLLLSQNTSTSSYGSKSMEDEVASSLSIENIDYNRESVRKIFQGFAPSTEQENRIYGIKKGLEFIADQSNIISEKNIYSLYEIAIGQFLDENDRLLPGEHYRNDSVFVVGQHIDHTGLQHWKLPEYMNKFVSFIQEKSHFNDLLKAAVIHFYFAYLHPYFDGNGRMARLLHMWYLRQQGYAAALFIPFSHFIQLSRKKYYDAFTLIEENAKISGHIDITPFLLYFIENVYDKLDASFTHESTFDLYTQLLDSGKITVKEKELWNFVLSVYGTDEFSTKQLERDFANAAYGTIRSFVIKFTEYELLKSQKYGNRVKYSITTTTK
ncbi:MAG: Fic family protein [Oscillospiraceae bacterium]|nr:Fic family protein [Oscillospiraceae bacterium]